MKRRILVFTGTRAEYGLLHKVLLHWVSMDTIESHLLVSGTHLEKEYGETISEIPDWIAKVQPVKISLSHNNLLGISQSMGEALAKYGAALHELQPDVVVVLGDRYEAFCMVSAASALRRPVAHLFGGETTEGAVDEIYRHAMTKMSHMHFTSCEEYRNRVIQMGENPEKVWNVGALGVENANTLSLMLEDEIRKDLGIPAAVPYLVVTLHPATLEDEEPDEAVRALLAALQNYPDLYVVFTGSNADAGGSVINQVLRQVSESNPQFSFFMSLGVRRYLSAVRYSEGVVGNSSSGVVEVPSLAVPVLDIGTRQQGRNRSHAVLHCDPNIASITESIKNLLLPATKGKASIYPNPYDKPGTAQQISEIIASYPLHGILKKTFYDIQF